MSNKNDSLITEAGRRPGLWMEERFTPSAWTRMLSEKMVPEYEERMEAIREFDDELEERLSNLPAYVDKLQKLSKSAKGALRAAKLAEVAILLNEINAALRFPAQKRQELLGSLGALTEADLLEFESAVDIDPSFLESYHKEFHEEIKGKKEKKSEAGFFSDLVRSLVSWKLQTPEMIKRDKALRKIIDQANVAVKKLQSERKKMNSARAGGNIAAYMKSLDNIDKIHQSFQDGKDGSGGYRAIYEKYLFAPMEKALQEKRDRGEEGPEVLDQAAVEEGEQAEQEAETQEGVLGEDVEEELGKMGPEEDDSAEGKEEVLDEEGRPSMPSSSEEGSSSGEYNEPSDEPGVTVLDPSQEEYYEYERRQLPGRDQPQQLSGGPYPELGSPTGDRVVYPRQTTQGPLSGPSDQPVVTPEPQYPALPAASSPNFDPETGWAPTREWVEEAPTDEAAQQRYQYFLNYVMPTQTRTPYTGASLQDAMNKLAHSKFMDELNKVAKTGNTGLMVAMLARYSEQIEKSDPESSQRLLTVAQELLNG